MDLCSTRLASVCAPSLSHESPDVPSNSDKIPHLAVHLELVDIQEFAGVPDASLKKGQRRLPI